SVGTTGAIVSLTTIRCVAVLTLPWPSSKLHVTSEVPCVVRVSGLLVVPVMVPLQLSVVVGAAVIVAEHSPVTSASVGTTGAIVSLTTIRCVAVLTLPWPSSKLQVTTEVPCVVRVSGLPVVRLVERRVGSVVGGGGGRVAEQYAVTSASVCTTGALVS